MNSTAADAGFQLAATASQAIVRQCLRHVETSAAKVKGRLDAAASSSPHGRDMVLIREGKLLLAMQQRVSHVEVSTSAMASQLHGLDTLLRAEYLSLLPCVTIARSLAELAATVSWLLDAKVDEDTRAARALASLFRAVDAGVNGTLPEDSEKLTALKAALMQSLEQQGVRFVRRARGDKVFEEIAQVAVGRAYAKTTFQFTARIDEQIPGLAGTYGNLSGFAHGEPLHAGTTWQRPDTMARLLGVVAQRATRAWSDAVHGWVGVQHGAFVNAADEEALVRSIPADVREAFEARSKVAT